MSKTDITISIPSKKNWCTPSQRRKFFQESSGSVGSQRLALARGLGRVEFGVGLEIASFGRIFPQQQ